MSRNYDNWERLVAAVLKRHQIWELCHAHSRNTSISSSSDASLYNDENTIKSQKISDFECEIEREWVERYVPSVYVTLVAFRDGTKDVKRVRFSQRRFTQKEAETWWLHNREKVYKKYKLSAGLDRLGQPSILVRADKSTKVPEDESMEQYEPGVHVTLVASRDGTTRTVKRVRFSRGRFQLHQALAWWLSNQEKVYEKYNIPGRVAPIRQLSVSSEG